MRAWLTLAVWTLACSAAAATHAPADPSPAGFDYYLLTLSWSPAWCVTRPDDRLQCRGRHYGFVLHGLWPQYAAGGHPENCEAERTVPADVIRHALPAMPSPRLIEHEWRAHGSCTGMDARSYFDRALRAYASVRVPGLFDADASAQYLTAEELARAFAGANPGLAPDQVALKCRGPELEEVRICLGKDLRPTACGRDVRTQCRRGPLRIRAIR